MIHQIHLTDLSEQKDVCKFELNVVKLNDELFDPQSNQTNFIMESESETINVYLNASPLFRSATVSIDCLYKKFILHRTELQFDKDKFLI